MMMNSVDQRYSFKDIASGKVDIKFADLYFPQVQMTGNDIFIKAHERDIGPDRNDQVIFVLLDQKGQIIDDNVDWLQVLPHCFIARLHIPIRNKVPEALVLDYIIDTDEILVDEVNALVQTDNSDTSSTIRFAQMRSVKIEGGYLMRGDTRIQLDEHFAQFDQLKNRQYIFSYFVPRG